MAAYGKESLKDLNTSHPDLITLFQEVVKVFDNSILYGTRTPAEQFELFKKGRKLVNGKWVIVNKSQVVTYKNGVNTKSNHNYSPSRAVDAMPFPVDWEDVKRMCFFAGHVISIADRLFDEGKIEHRIKWGGDWDMDTNIKEETFLDLCHFEIVPNENDI